MSERDGGNGGRRRATINDIARMSGVSKKTVSRVINKSPFVKAETREKIEKIIAESGYRPDPTARGLAFRRSFLVGLIYNQPNPQYIVQSQQGILSATRAAGLELAVHPCHRADPDLLDQIHVFVEQLRLYGVILTPSVSEDEAVKYLAGVEDRMGLPAVDPYRHGAGRLVDALAAV